VGKSQRIALFRFCHESIMLELEIMDSVLFTIEMKYFVNKLKCSFYNLPTKLVPDPKGSGSGFEMPKKQDQDP